MFALLEHPERGVGLFDTGYATRFYEATRSWPFRMYRWLTPARVPPGQDAVAQLQARGVSADDVAWIVVSHFDPDHIGGLRDFPRARVYCLPEAWDAIQGLRGIAAMRRRLLPEQIPEDLASRLTLIGPLSGAPLGPLSATHDLFADGSIRLVSLPGHAPGHMGAVVRVRGGAVWFLAADAAWCRAAIRSGRGALHRRLAYDRAMQDETYALLARVSEAFPEWIVIPSHCPEAAEALLPGGLAGITR
jgi:glyoxylase-like metal-dependent hydrolase (beta-lactamase superfamily II)